ncbi:CPXV144 protein [Cowpox virus]|uniref:CPXV144 protein n=1 Tax=Cowpox virus TaxID=10243 RepID=A0A290GQ84_COWPX|nr:CPXV144 protein [Cowpox virus]
MADKKKFSR